jgi:hypothetical protein
MSPPTTEGGGMAALTFALGVFAFGLVVYGSFSDD